MKIFKGDIEKLKKLNPYPSSATNLAVAYMEGQQSILSQMVEVDLNAKLKEYEYYCTQCESISCCSPMTFEQFIQEEKDNGNER
jgi:hypothetical protein